MGAEEDEIGVTLAHLILAGVAGRAFTRTSGKGFTIPGMHANLLIHGVLGMVHYQSKRLSIDVAPLYNISLAASKYLALPCLMADLYSGDSTLSAAHLLSGVVPFVLSLLGNDNKPLGLLMVACNVVSLCYYAHTKDNKTAWFTAGGAVFAYFVPVAASQIHHLYPLGLAVMNIFAADIGRSSITI